MSTEIVTIESIAEIAGKNRPMIKDKVDKALAALSKIKTVTSPEEDKLANDILTKCNATLPIIDGLRKEYTSVIDDWKKKEMEFEKSLKAEMERIRTLRNEYAKKIASEYKATAEAAEKTKLKEQEIARMKSEMKSGVELGLVTRVNEGDKAIAALFAKMTLENFDSLASKLNFTPLLKEEMFRSFLKIEFNPTIISLSEMAELTEKAYKHFNYEKCNATYVAAVNEVIERWRAQLPTKKAELQKIASSSGEEAKKLKAEAEARQKAAQEGRDREAKEQTESVAKKAAEQLAQDTLQAEFKQQVTAQSMEEQSGVRKSYSYRFADEKKIVEDPMYVITTLSKVMMNLYAEQKFLGIIERDSKSQLPKRDKEGRIQYVDGVQYWLNWLAKIRPLPTIEGLELTEDITTVAKKS